MKVGLIGAGNLARAMARGWGEPVLCSDAGSGSGRSAALVAELGGRSADNVEVAQEADLVVLCHEPSQFEQVAEEIKPHAKAVVSVLGSISGAVLQARYAPVPAFHLTSSEGVFLYSRAAHTDAELERSVLEMFGRLGAVIEVGEDRLASASAVLSVGPAFEALAAQAQVDAAVGEGLVPELAARLVAETMSGTAALLAARNYDTVAVRHEVASPGGSTARGLDALERAGVGAALQAAVDRVSGAMS